MFSNFAVFWRQTFKKFAFVLIIIFQECVIYFIKEFPFIKHEFNYDMVMMLIIRKTRKINTLKHLSRFICYSYLRFKNS